MSDENNNETAPRTLAMAVRAATKSAAPKKAVAKAAPKRAAPKALKASPAPSKTTRATKAA